VKKVVIKRDHWLHNSLFLRPHMGLHPLRPPPTAEECYACVIGHIAMAEGVQPEDLAHMQTAEAEEAVLKQVLLRRGLAPQWFLDASRERLLMRARIREAIGWLVRVNDREDRPLAEREVLLKEKARELDYDLEFVC
jgi:hypothetical protein